MDNFGSLIAAGMVGAGIAVATVFLLIGTVIGALVGS